MKTKTSQMASALILTLLTVYVTNTLAQNRASETKHPAFLVKEERLFLVGSDEAELKKECDALRTYGTYYSQINPELQPITNQAQCRVHYLPDFSLDEYTIPADGVEQKAIYHLLPGPMWSIDVSEILPRSMWERHQESAQDGVCYNSALVESGILTERHRSSFLRQINFLLGMNGIQNIATPTTDQNHWIIQYGTSSNSPYVKYRNVWDISGTTKNELWPTIQSNIEHHFSPGSILCFSIDPPETKEDLITKIYESPPGVAMANNASTLPEDFYIESEGGHCMVLLTPGLASEANQRAPKRLLAWRNAYEFYTDMLIDMNDSGRIFYFQIDHQETLNNSFLQAGRASSRRFAKLEKLAQQHHTIYESASSNTCPFMGHIDFYNPGCMGNNLDAVHLLLDFWEEFDSAISSELFKDFKKAQSKMGVFEFQGFDRVAYSIFVEMTYTRDRFREILEETE